jgi:prophage DNA circulation protein
LAAHILLEQAFSLAEAATVILEMENEQPVLGPADQEIITGDTRRAIQAATETHRALFGFEAYGLIETLRNLADTVGTLAAGALAKTPPIIGRIVPTAMTPYLLAHTWYGDFQRAGDLRRLNPVLARRPHDWRAGEEVRAYVR